MVFVTVKDALAAKIGAFTAGVQVPGVAFVLKSSCSTAEVKLANKCDAHFHRLEIKVKADAADWPELLLAVGDEVDAEVMTKNSSRGHERNKKYLIISNIKRFGTIFGIDRATIRSLSAGVRRYNKELDRFAVIGAAIRTSQEIRAPGLLLFRSWHGRVPGVQFTTVTAKTAADVAATPVMPIDITSPTRSGTIYSSSFI